MTWVGEVLPGWCDESGAGGWGGRRGAVRGGWGDWLGRRVCGGRRGLGGGEGGAISGRPAPRGSGPARDSLGRIFWAGWRRGLGLCGGGWAALERPGGWGWCGGGAALGAEEAGLKPAATKDGEQTGAGPGRQERPLRNPGVVARKTLTPTLSLCRPETSWTPVRRHGGHIGEP